MIISDYFLIYKQCVQIMEFFLFGWEAGALADVREEGRPSAQWSETAHTRSLDVKLLLLATPSARLTSSNSPRHASNAPCTGPRADPFPPTSAPAHPFLLRQ